MALILCRVRSDGSLDLLVPSREESCPSTPVRREELGLVRGAGGAGEGGAGAVGVRGVGHAEVLGGFVFVVGGGLGGVLGDGGAGFDGEGGVGLTLDFALDGEAGGLSFLN